MVGMALAKSSTPCRPGPAPSPWSASTPSSEPPLAALTLPTCRASGTARWKKLYQLRGAVERENGRLKNEWALLPLRIRRIERVRLHADLTMLARLATALAKART